MIGAESVLITGVGILLAAAVAVPAILGLLLGIASRAPTVTLEVPWLPIGGVAVACLTITLLASVIPAAVLLRQRPVQRTP